MKTKNVTISGDMARLIADYLYDQFQDNESATALIEAIDEAEGAEPPITIMLLVKD